MDEKWIINRLFVAIPELGTNKSFVQRLVELGVISQGQYKIWRRVAKLHAGVKKLRNKTLIERLMVVAPELISVRTVNLLSKMGLVDQTVAHPLRVLLRVAGRIGPDALEEGEIVRRLALIFDDVFSPTTIAWIRALEDEQIQALAQIMRTFPEGFGAREAIFGHRAGTLTSGDGEKIREMLVKSITRAQILRSVVSESRAIRRIVIDASKLDNVWDVLTLTFDHLFGEQLLKNLVRAGVISPERFELVRSLQNFSAGIWRKAVAAGSYDNWAARTLLMSEGVLSHQTVKVLLELGLISQNQATILYPTMSAIRGITRAVGSNWRKSHRYRVVPGEPPIRTFARFSSKTDRAILKLLSEAAEDARKDAEALMKTARFAQMTRANQQRLITNRLHLTMRQMFENTGSLIIFGEKEAARAAIGAMSNLEKVYGVSSRDLQRTLKYTAQSGVDSYISREENLRLLSRRVYRNVALYSGRVDREIAKALLRGQSAQELATLISRYIRPDVPGGTSYAAMRLARTEINNAFHFTQIRYTREMPWVEGYRWNLSGSHGRVDVCNDMSERNHDGLGRGVFAKGNVPGKPHPQCLCFITSVTADTKTFYSRYRSGAYDRYINGIADNGVFDEDRYTPEANRDVIKKTSVRAFLELGAQATRAAAYLLSR